MTQAQALSCDSIRRHHGTFYCPGSNTTTAWLYVVIIAIVTAMCDLANRWNAMKPNPRYGSMGNSSYREFRFEQCHRCFRTAFWDTLVAHVYDAFIFFHYFWKRSRSFLSGIVQRVGDTVKKQKRSHQFRILFNRWIVRYNVKLISINVIIWMRRDLLYLHRMTFYINKFAN